MNKLAEENVFMVKSVVGVNEHSKLVMVWQCWAVSSPKSLETHTHSHRPLAQCISLTAKASDFLIQPPLPGCISL